MLDLPLKKNGNTLGIDQGYKKLLSCSNGKIIGQDMESIYKKISNKKQGSKAFKRLLVHRTNEINKHCNSLDLQITKEIVIEDLKNLKHKSKLSTKFMNKMQRWSYPQVISKLESLCQLNGILLTKVDPAYTSQTCSDCGNVDKKNRNGEDFNCQQCGMKIDADLNAAINISRMGVYNPHNPKNNNFIDFQRNY
jgi:putative transposase